MELVVLYSDQAVANSALVSNLLTSVSTMHNFLSACYGIIIREVTII
jgi:hypothetical protein